MKIKGLSLVSTVLLSLVAVSCGKSSSNSSSPQADQNPQVEDVNPKIEDVNAQIEGVWSLTGSVGAIKAIKLTANSQLYACVVDTVGVTPTKVESYGPVSYSYVAPTISVTDSETGNVTSTTYDAVSDTIKNSNGHFFIRISSDDLVTINKAGCDF